MSCDTFVLVDGSGYLYRAYHAMPPLSNSRGEPTGAVYGVANMLRRLASEYQLVCAAVVFDAKGKTFRHELYPEYKANRPPTPPDLAAQIPLIHQIVEAMGFPLIMEAEVEADDVMATLAVQAQAAGMHTLIFSGDKDMAQMVNSAITLVNPSNDVRLDPQGVKEKYGVPPELIVDYLTLMGDSSDNVPGVAKVGPKTAAKWLQSYGSLEALTENSEKIKGKIGENLRSALATHLPLSRKLVTLRSDLDLSQTPQTLICRSADIPVLRSLYKNLKFNSWLADLPAESPQTATDGPGNEFAAPAPKDYQTILDQASFDAWLERLNQAELFAFDTETDSLAYMEAKLVGISFAVKAGEGAYVPLAHDYLGAPAQLSREAVLAALKPLLEDPAKLKLGQNLKYDAHILKNYAIDLQGMAHDTMLTSYVLDSNGTRHGMDALALKHLGVKTIHFEDIAGKGAKQLTFNQIALEQAGPYAAEDAEITLQLHQVLQPKLQSASPKLAQVLEKIEIPLVPVLCRMERNGVQVNAGLLHTHSRELAKRLRLLEQEAYTTAGEKFNLGSPKQLQVILFEKMGLPVLSKTPKKQPSTAESVLQELALDYELPRLIMEHRTLSKLKSTYTDKLPKEINPRTGRVHTSYQQAVAATGRLSSSAPNLQNIPIRTPEGRRIRQTFVAPPGYRLLAADYSQIELRIMAHLSQDAGLLNAFAKGEDVHRATAAEMFGVLLDAVSDDQRRSAKAVNFGLIYGMSAFGLAKQLKISRTVAKEYVDRYFVRYPGVKAYMDDTRELAREQGYVETVFGRRLYLPEINSRNAKRRQYAERTAINAPMQGTAADIIKLAMIRTDKWLANSSLDIKMIMQVHDELVFELAESAIDDASAAIKEAMTGAAGPELNSVDLTVNIDSGLNWDDAH
ncbi:MAG: DNA polymerase I [Gammaproteobacteria bacterium]|nr:DNA polymerase I [Gammaproteobacteria bacterium]